MIMIMAHIKNEKEVAAVPWELAGSTEVRGC